MSIMVDDGLEDKITEDIDAEFDEYMDKIQSKLSKKEQYAHIIIFYESICPETGEGVDSSQYDVSKILILQDYFSRLVKEMKEKNIYEDVMKIYGNIKLNSKVEKISEIINI